MRPSKHIRHVRTKKGIKPVLINPTIQKKQKRAVQTLIFPKEEYDRKEALAWSKKHGFKHYTSREEKNTVRVRQFPPEQAKTVLGTFNIGDTDVKGLYVIKKRGAK